MSEKWRNMLPIAATSISHYFNHSRAADLENKLEWISGKINLLILLNLVAISWWTLLLL